MQQPLMSSAERDTSDSPSSQHTSSPTRPAIIPSTAGFSSSVYSMEDPSRKRPVTQDEVDAQGRLPLKERFHHIAHREINSSKNTCGAVPCASRLPDVRLSVCVLGGETELGSHLVRGLSNPAYATAWSVRVVEMGEWQQCRDVQSLADKLRGAHTVISANSSIVQQGDRYVDVNDDAAWRRLIDACLAAKVKRFLPSPFRWDLQLARPPKKHERLPALIQRANDRRQLLTEQKELGWTLLSLGVLTEQLFSPLAGVDVQGAVVRVPPTLGRQTRITTTTLDDLARMLPEILLSSKSHNALVHLCSNTISYDEIAQIVQQVAGKNVLKTDASVTEEQRHAAYEPQCNDASTTFFLLMEGSTGLWWPKGNSWNAGHIPHVQTTPIAEWARLHFKLDNAPAGPQYQPNLHTSHTGLAPIPPSPAQMYFTVAT